MTDFALSPPHGCFYERDVDLAIYRRAMSEAAGTLLLVFAASSAGLITQQIMPESLLLGRMTVAITIAGSLVGLIVAFGSASGGHFNPLISLTQWLAGERKLNCALAYVGAQVIGACAGALLANEVFGTTGHIAVQAVDTPALILSEFLDSAGLMVIVLGCARSGRSETGPFAVGAWLVAAIIATPSASYANPALTLGALFSTGPIRLTEAHAIYYLLAQFAGGSVALLVMTIVYPQAGRFEISVNNQMMGFGEGI
jgi:glycerol uptake facilitator-like aquaporin